MVRTRIGPSPTGSPHIATIYQALFNYAFARKNKGRFIVRIEDTDQKRYVPSAEREIFESLDWFGLKPDEKYKQSERLKIYRKYAQRLVKKDLAYESEGAIRMRIPKNRNIEFIDGIRGKIKFDSNIIDDQVILKSDGYPTYHLAVVVDDHLMEISHVVRGEEWISSAPKHILLYEYFGWNLPKFFHTPIIRNPDGSKLSKRHGHTSVSWYREQGFLPEAILNFISLLGWSHPEEKEIFSLDEFISAFDLKDISPAGPKFDLEKLIWMNGMYIRSMSIGDLADRIRKFDKSLNVDKKVVSLVQERIKKFSEYEELTDFFYDKEIGVNRKLDISLLTSVHSLLVEVKSWKSQNLEEVLRKYVKENSLKPKKVFMSIRFAITGKKATPPLFDTMEVLGRKKTLERLKNLI